MPFRPTFASGEAVPQMLVMEPSLLCTSHITL
jgi:hypothetical protein